MITDDDDDKKKNNTDTETPNRPQAELWDQKTVLKFYGGSKSISVSALYKGMASDPPRYPKPINVGPNTVRWLADECRAALQRMISERDGRKRLTRKGDHRLHRISTNT